MIGAFDIGGTKIAAGAVDESGRILASEECPTEPEQGFDDAMGRMQAMLARCIARSGQTLDGIGIGCTGPVDPFRGVISEVQFLRSWKNSDLAGRLAAAFNVDAALENDADAHTLGEYFWGAGRGCQRFIMVTVGTGIGGGVILDGRLYRGANGVHPEFGHHVIDPSGASCSCGARGCWESLASGTALSAWFLAHHPDQPPMSAQAICAAAEQGNSAAQEAVVAMGDYLGLGLANLVNLFAPERIALGGGLMGSYHLFRERILAALEMHTRLIPKGTANVLRTSLGEDSGLAGAASVWMHRFGKLT
jgi:glucokinase